SLTFGAWLEGVGRHVTDVSGWGEDEWGALFRHVDEDIDDTVHSQDPASPEAHMAVLGWIRDHAPAELVSRRLRWLSPDPRPGLVGVEATNDAGQVFLDLPPPILERLAFEKLIIRAQT